MQLRLENGLLVASCILKYTERETLLQNVLLDTGCAVSIFDVDLMEDIGIKPDKNLARIVHMYGIGGESESCIEQHIQNLTIGGHLCRHFLIQLGPTLSRYGFDAILGNDFMVASGSTINLANLTIQNNKSPESLILN